ncbi:MAG: inositol monophosphatase family protein [Acidimicrobiales bacterium]
MRADVVGDVDTKSSAVDLVTKADKAVEAQLVAGILAARPDDGVLGEEGSGTDGRSGVRWILDPIDGTTNYVYDRPDYAVSVGVEADGEMVAGAVVPARKTGTISAGGQGSGRHSQRRPDQVQHARLACGLPHRHRLWLPGPTPTSASQRARRAATARPDIRRGGSARSIFVRSPAARSTRTTSAGSTCGPRRWLDHRQRGGGHRVRFAY